MDNSLKCIIVDDEKKDRENMRLLLESYCPTTEIIGEAENRESILELLTTSDPDLVFMDIQIGASTIFDIIKKIDQINFKIVFVTAFDKYAIKGYEYNAIDYLLKPVDPRQLIKVVNKIQTIKKATNQKEQINNNFKAFYTNMTEGPKISITDAKGIHIIKVVDILYALSNGNYTTLILNHDSELVISKNLKHFEDRLNRYNFLRIHKSCLVNLDHIDFLVKEQGGAVIMKNGKSLPISRNNRKELYMRMNIMS
jgi:two-component system LytT family response regulator